MRACDHAAIVRPRSRRWQIVRSIHLDQFKSNEKPGWSELSDFGVRIVWSSWPTENGCQRRSGVRFGYAVIRLVTSAASSSVARSTHSIQREPARAACLGGRILKRIDHAFLSERAPCDLH